MRRKIASLALLVFLCSCEAANILGVILHTSYSHQIPYRALWRELSLRGHKLTVLTTDPMRDSNLSNLTEIDISVGYGPWENSDIIAVSERENFHSVFTKMMVISEKVIEAEFNVAEVQQLLKGDAKFDLVIAEFFYPVTVAFSVKFDCPLIITWSTDLTGLGHEFLGNYNHILQHPTFQLAFDHPLTLAQRVFLFVGYFMEMSLTWKYTGYFDQIIRKHFGEDYPSSMEILQERMGVAFINANPAFSNVRPLVPATVLIGGGIHVQPAKPLPEDLRRFLDGATEGAIYFSLGSNVLSKDIPKEKLEGILSAFAELPFKVLWKFEAEGLETKPKNVKLVKWAPQQDVLRHPNLKVFITQGGLQSIEEAMCFHVPLVVIPRISDQFFNAERIVRKGMGLKLDFHSFTKEQFKDTIFEVASNPRFRNQMKKLDDFAKDQPLSGLEKAVWWTEYVLRHKDFRNLRGFAAGKHFYSYFDLDVFAILSTVVLGSILALIYCLKVINTKYKLVAFNDWWALRFYANFCNQRRDTY